MIKKYEMEAMASQVMVGLEEKIAKLESNARKISQYMVIDRWRISKEVEEKLTVALIKPDAQKYIEKIITQVVDSIKL